MIIVCQKFLKNTKISGITLFPFIFVKNPEDKYSKELINHEKIHLRQQAELLVIFFYIWYVAEYYYRLFTLRSRDLAYRSISFEREAYDNERNPDYLRTRKFWAFTKYVRG